MMSDVVSVRRAGPADALCLGVLATQVFLETYATEGIRPALAREVEAECSVAAVLERLEDPARWMAIAERDGHAIAFAELVVGAGHRLAPGGRTAELVRLYVQSPFLRQGVGSLLLDGAEARAATQGAASLWLTAWVGNRRARAFYASRGYEDVGRHDHVFEGETFENRLFVKALPSEVAVPARLTVPTADPRCVLRRWRADDAASLVRHADDRAVWRNMTHRFPHPYTPADATAWLRIANAPSASVHLAIALDGEAVGGIGAIAGEGIFERTAQFGYWLGQAHWGHGLATAAARAMVGHLRATTPFVRLEAPVFAWNPASMRVLEKAGFVREGVLRRSVLKDGVLVDSVMHALVADA